MAQALSARGIQFAFASGYGETAEFAVRFPGVPVLTKPYTADDLRKTFTDFARTL